ncbi:ribonuclease H-like domain-containing protein [Mycena sanguinolenta]|nr:ribonuclease H-like domain-containing protein [Mycena sanguinolenta]
MNFLVSVLRSCFARRSDKSAPITPASQPAMESAPSPETEPYPTPPYLYIVTTQEADHHLQTIQRGAVIGLDIESVQQPSGPKLTRGQKRDKLQAQIRDKESFVIDWSEVEICLVQIATEAGEVYVINLRVIAELPTELVRICESPDILKVSAGIFSDGQRLWDSFRLNLLSVVSLGLVARLAYPTTLLRGVPFANEPGLVVIVSHVLRYKLSKEHQTSDWDAASLSTEQKDYAAMDTHATLMVYLAMRTILASCEVPVLPAWYTYDIVHRSRVKCGTQKEWVAHCPWWSEDRSQGFEARR